MSEKNTAAVQCYAIFGGTFDPVHNGHVAVVRYLLSQDSDVRVIVSCAYCSPFKQHCVTVASPQQRLDMLRRVFGGMSRVIIDSGEVEARRISYSVDLVARLRLVHGITGRVDLVMGSDLVDGIRSWKDARCLAGMTRLVIYPRKRFPLTRARRNVLEQGDYQFTYMVLEDARQMDISSTRIRADAVHGVACDAGKRAQIPVPRAVLEYTRRHNLYGESLVAHENFFAALSQRHSVLIQLLHVHVNANRAAHCLRVAKMSVRYAVHCASTAKQAGNHNNQSEGVPSVIEDAFVAAVAHDICREFDNETLLHAAEEYAVPISSCERENPALLHGPVAVPFVSRFYSISEESAAAIRVHTLGCANPTAVQKILFLCDSLEQGRALWATSEGAKIRAAIMRHGSLNDKIRELLRHTVRRFGDLLPETEAMRQSLGN